MGNCTVAALELPHRYGDVAAQLALTDRLLAQARGAHLAVLSECALTGYLSEGGDYDLRRFAEPLDGPTAMALSALARKHRLALAAPLIEASGADRFNAFVVFDAEGKRIAHYRKRNPWIPETWAAPGNLSNPVFEVEGTSFTIAICFDVHFLAVDAGRQLREAEVLLFPSAWVDDEPGDGRDALLPDLARQFGIGIVNPNWGVGTPAVPGQGGSRVVLPSGEQVRATGPVLVSSGFSARPGRDL